MCGGGERSSAGRAPGNAGGASRRALSSSDISCFSLRSVARLRVFSEASSASSSSIRSCAAGTGTRSIRRQAKAARDTLYWRTVRREGRPQDAWR